MADDLLRDPRLRNALHAFKRELSLWVVSPIAGGFEVSDVKRHMGANERRDEIVIGEVRTNLTIERRHFSSKDNADTFVVLHALRKAIEAAK